MKAPTANRNDPCPCGSGLKYKKCCLGKGTIAAPKPALPDIESSIDRVIAYATSGNLLEATRICKMLLDAYPQNPRIFYTTARVMLWNGMHDTALALLEKAIGLKPDNAAYFGLLADVYWCRQEPFLPLQAIAKAIELDPDEPSYIHSRAVFIFKVVNSHDTEHAIDSLRQLVITHPTFFRAYETLYHILDERMCYEEAASVYQKLVAQHPPVEWLLPFLAVVQKNYASREEIAKEREVLEQKIDQIAASGVTLNSASGIRNVLFPLTYHAQNNRPLLEKLSALYRKIYPAINVDDPTVPQRVAGTVLKIGFVSAYFFEGHVVMVLLQQIIRSFAVDPRYHTILFDIGGNGGALPLIKETRVTHVALPDNLSGATYQLMAEQACDVLIYLDIGMNLTSYLLAFARLAPIQCCLNGHPITTGISTMDYYVSSKLWEAPHAQEYYSETLITLDHLLAAIDKPDIPTETYSRKEFGFPEDCTLYACPVTTGKIHPDFYQLVANILKKDPNGCAVFFHYTGVADEVVLKHLQKMAPEESERVVFVPWIEKHQFMPAMKLCDVIIDTVHFGSFITLFSIFAVGTPVVTWTGEFCHGRVATACYRLMNIPELIAETWDDYVEIAVRLGTNTAFNQAMRKRIIDNNQALYGDHGASEELKQVLETLIARKQEVRVL